jgi:hypothetical protein
VPALSAGFAGEQSGNEYRSATAFIRLFGEEPDMARFLYPAGRHAAARPVPPADTYRLWPA